MLQIQQDNLKDEWEKLLFQVPPGSAIIVPPTEEKMHRTPNSPPEPKQTEPRKSTPEENSSVADSTESNNQDGSGDINSDINNDKQLWSQAWKVWLSIGLSVTSPPNSSKSISNNSTSSSSLYVPSQPFLTALILIFPPLYEHIKSGGFGSADLQKLCVVLQQSLAVPVHSDATPFIVPIGEVALTPLQESVLEAINVLHKVRRLFLITVLI